ncbi:tetraspanin-31 isoform X2 [Phalacrocorax carbo]|uniref:tetraspanin-31 isoform X2 n=1 Tax=Phalacrocorax carbo TaxID=9209 RepID=UPI00311A0B3C
MVCGGFACSRNALCALNVVYVLVGLLLIGVAAWGKGFGIVSSIHLIGGVIAVGVFLLLIAIVGLVGAVHHHQVMLFFYMIILGLVFVFQFGVSCSCLAIDRSRQEGLFSSAWSILSNETKAELEQRLDCCGLLNRSADPAAARAFQADFRACPACKTLLGKDPRAKCLTCGEKMLQHSDEALKILGGVGLFFSFTEVLGVWAGHALPQPERPPGQPQRLPIAGGGPRPCWGLWDPHPSPPHVSLLPIGRPPPPGRMKPRARGSPPPSMCVSPQGRGWPVAALGGGGRAGAGVPGAPPPPIPVQPLPKLVRIGYLYTGKRRAAPSPAPTGVCPPTSSPPPAMLLGEGWGVPHTRPPPPRGVTVSQFK